MSMPVLYWGAQDWTQYARFDLTRAEQGRRDLLSASAGNTPANAAHHTNSLLYCNVTLLTHVQPGVPQDP